jgi:hypothetical protein
VVDQVGFEMAKLVLLPGDAAGRDTPGDRVDRRGPPAGQQPLILGQTLEATPHAGYACLSRLLHGPWGKAQSAMLGQVRGHPHLVGLEAFGAQVIQALCDDLEGMIHLPRVAPAARCPSLLLIHVALDQPDQALGVQARHCFHLVL